MTPGQRALLVGLVIVFGAVAIYLWFFGWTTVFALQARSLGEQSPILYKLPTPLVDSSISPSSGRKFSIDQFEFEIPWTDIEEVQTKAPQNWLRLISNNGVGVAVIANKPDSLVEKLRLDNKFGPRVKGLFEPEILESDYSLAKYMLETTPDLVRPISPRREAVDRLTMLRLKAILLPASASTGIFQVETPKFHGFQYGDPAKGPRGIQVNLYSADGKLEFIFSRKNGPVTITQPEINRVLQTVHKKIN